MLLSLSKVLAILTISSKLIHTKHRMRPAEINRYDCSGNRRVIPVRFYASDEYAQFLITQGKSLNQMIYEIISNVEHKINNGTVKHTNTSCIKFDPKFEYDVPQGINLSDCSSNIQNVGNVLNSFYLMDPDVPVIAIMNCNRDTYNDRFEKMGIEIPHIVHDINLACAKRVITFIEVEKPRFIASISAALLKIAGSEMNNSVRFEEVDGGDEGFRYDMFISSSAIKHIAESECFRIKE